MPRFPSSIAIPKSGGSRVLRLRAEERLADMISAPQGADGAGYLEVPSRESVRRGENLRVEISFGPLADEIEFEGMVAGLSPRASGAPLVKVLVAKQHATRLAYVREVLTGMREPTARRHRRIEKSIPCRWAWGLSFHNTLMSNFSRGGAFISADAPPGVGSQVEVEFELAGETIKLPATVPWIRDRGKNPGFAVNFHIKDREVAQRLADSLRGLGLAEGPS